MEDPYGGRQAAASQFEASKKEAHDLTGTLTDAQLNWRPAPEKWSIGQCLFHLATTDQVLGAIDRAIANARARGWVSSGPFRYGWFTRWMIKSMEPPPKRRMRTFPILTPPTTPLSRDEVLRTFDASRERLLERIRAAGGLDLERAIVISPVNRLIRMPLGGYLAFLAAHDRRHLWQARSVKAAPGFGE